MLPSMRLNKQDFAGFRLLAAMFAAPAEQAMSELLEQKHLYQSVTITWPNMNAVHDFVRARNARFDGDHEHWIRLHQILVKSEWRIVAQSEWHFPEHQGPGDVWFPLMLRAPTIKVYCQECDAVYPFSFVCSAELQELASQRDDKRIPQIPDPVQVIVLRYQCQGCKSRPESFLVERRGPKIKLSGRAPMEKVVVPHFIPKQVREYYSGAVIAFNSGAILAAKFLLRTLVEQYVRLRADPALRNTQDIDLLFQGYAATLPDSLKREFPSLNTVYSRLSAEIHGADASPEAYLQTKADIEQHFDAKRVYRLPD